MELKTTIPFVYKWTELSTSMWYIGARFAAGCHPEDGYICSSKIVKPKVLNNPSDWKREILQLCSTPIEAKQRETEILLESNAAQNPQSYNQTNSDGKFHRSGPHREESIHKMKKLKAGEKNPMFGRPGPMKGKLHKEESKLQIGQSLAGRELPEEVALKISESLTGLSWINNGVESKRIDLNIYEIPLGWVLGMTPEHVEKLAETRRGENHWAYGQPMPESTKAKISHTLTGRKESDVTKQRKRDNAKNRPQTQCAGCGNLYYACHKRHHLKCV
jgi:hypothetical protein